MRDFLLKLEPESIESAEVECVGHVAEEVCLPQVCDGELRTALQDVHDNGVCSGPCHLLGEDVQEGAVPCHTGAEVVHTAE